MRKKPCRYEIIYDGEPYCGFHLYKKDFNGIWYPNPVKCNGQNKCWGYKRKVRKHNYTDFLYECWKEHNEHTERDGARI